MINIVTQENIRSIIPAKVARVAYLYAEKMSVSYLDALKKFYKTSIYKDLEVEKTKVWWQSPAEIVEDWCNQEKSRL